VYSIASSVSRPSGDGRLASAAQSVFIGVALAVSELNFAAPAHSESPFATAVVSYVPGSGAAPGYGNPLVALGSPERFTGEGLFPQTVTPFQPAFLQNEIVSLGVGGSLVLAFDHDVLDDPRNPFGVDLLVFGNAFATDAASPAGVVGGLFSEGGAISLSADGVTWIPVPGVAADGPFPTLGYVDVAPYATSPGSVPTDFTRPVNPSLGGPELIGVPWAELVMAYDGSGGGTGIDFRALGIDRVRYVRIEGNVLFGSSPEIDAVADVSPVEPNPDLNGDGVVNAADLAILLGAWGPGPSSSDLSGDDAVNARDLAILLGAWS